MNYFTIKDVENLTGIKAHTLRVWEQRYGLHLAKRKESQHRYYDNEDLKRILRIVNLYHNGYKISAIAHLTDEDVKDLTLKTISQQTYDLYISQLLEAARDYDQPRFEKIIHAQTIHLGMEKAMTQVLFPFMEKMGMLWLADQTIPAQINFSTHLIQKKLIVAIDGLDFPPGNSKRLVGMFLPEHENHETALLFMQYKLRQSGIRTKYFGRNVPFEALEIYNSVRPLTHLYTHFVTNLQNIDTQTYLEKLSQRFPAQEIFCSGIAIQDIEQVPGNVHLLKTKQEMETFSHGEF